MNTEQKIAVVKKFMKQKICFGLKVEDSDICKRCHIATECAPMRRARLAYEEQLLEVTVAKSEVDAEFEARMESMSKAKFEAMIAKALRREAEFKALIAKAHSREAKRKPPISKATVPHAQQCAQVVTLNLKGRPRTAKEKSGQVLALAARGMTRQAIASELSISLASVYRILKESRSANNC
jgi:DNA invertase Pin-like site-specific DNA recombinase